MFGKLFIAIVVILGGFYAVYRFTGDYTFLNDGDNVDKHPGVTKFNVEVVSARISSGLMLVESPRTGIGAISVSGVDDEHLMHAKKCGRIKVHLDTTGNYIFDGAGCFLDW